MIGQPASEIDRLLFDRQLPGLGAGHHQQRFGDPLQTSPFDLHTVQRFLVFLGATRAPSDHFDQAQQPSKRRTELVRGIAGESQLLFERVLPAAQQLIEADRQIMQLVARAGHRQPIFVMRGLHAAHGARHRRQRLERLTAQPPAGGSRGQPGGRRNHSERRAELVQCCPHRRERHAGFNGQLGILDVVVRSIVFGMP